MELDIFIPSLNMGIEYDGSHYHENEMAMFREKYKYDKCFEKGIYLVRIKEKEVEGYIAYCDSLIIRRDGYSYDSLDECIKDLMQKHFKCRFTRYINTKEDEIAIRESYMVRKKGKSLASEYPELVKEWHRTKNGTLEPEMFAPHSNQEVWWYCSLHHYEYQEKIRNKTNGTRCPVCSGKVANYALNDIVTTGMHKEYNYIASELRYPDNNWINFRRIPFDSHMILKWRCKKDHTWMMSCYDRTIRKKSSPICAGIELERGFNDIKTVFPDVAAEWDYEKNGRLRPEMYTRLAKDLVSWKCKEGHEWQDSIARRCNGMTCPYCSNRKVWKGYNDLASQQPFLLSEWNPEKNPGLSPDSILATSTREVYWKCGECGNEWKKSPAERCRGGQCPRCVRKKRKDQKRKPVVAYDKFWDRNVEYKSIQSAAKWCNVSPMTVSKCCRDKGRGNKRYCWRFNDAGNSILNPSV